jgi:hypothetical protein
MKQNAPNDLLLLFIKDLLVTGNQYIFGGQVKFEILVAQGQPHHDFWITETLLTCKMTTQRE